jgi:glutaconate CoA-transferase subunit A
MAEFYDLRDAVSALVKDGSMVALEGFTHLIPTAAGQEIIRQRRRNLHLVRMTPDIIYDQMIGMGCATKLTFSWGGNPGVGSLHRFREAIQSAVPHQLSLEEHSHADLAARYQAGASGLPFAILRGYVGSDLPKHNRNIRFMDCPFTGETLAVTPALTPDVTIIHAQRADRRGNVLIQGIIGIQKEAALAARHVIVTVEEIVDTLNAPMNACVLPGWIIDYICEVPRGAHPSYAHGYYERDNLFCKKWDSISKDNVLFLSWMDRHILNTHDFAEFQASLEAELRSEVSA